MCDGSEPMAGSKDMAGSNRKDQLKSYYLVIELILKLIKKPQLVKVLSTLLSLLLSPKQ